MSEFNFVRDHQTAVVGAGGFAPQSGTAVAAGRVWYSDDDGTPWSVRERPPATRADGRRVLVFERPGAFRTVTGYPADWASLTRAELMALCEQR